MEILWQDVRYGIRMLAKSPAFTSIAILTLTLGIGANTALFSVVNAVLLSPLRYPNPEQLTMVYTRTENFREGASVSYPNFLDWEKENRSFEVMGAFRHDNANLTNYGPAERLREGMVSAGFFPMLGVKPLAGRLFTREEDRAGAAPVVLITEGLWKRKFGGAGVVGKPITLSGTDYTIVGIVPASFFFDRKNEVYTPLGQWTDTTFRDRRVSMGTRVIARLKPEVRLPQAQSDMEAIGASLAATYPEADAKTSVLLVPLKKDVLGDIAPFLYILLGAVGFVLLIACANVANLTLARSSARAREFAIRAALGASRGRVIRQLLTESVLLSGVGGALGLGLAAWGTKAVLKTLPDAVPRASEIGMDARVLVFTLAVSALSGILFGLAPALRMLRPELQEELKEGGRGASGARHRAQGVFVAAEMALALVLLIGAGLMIRSMALLWGVNPGFNPHNVLTFDVAFAPNMATKPPDAVRASLREINRQIEGVPGVEAASIQGGALPMNGDSELPFWLEGQAKPVSDNEMNWALFYLVDPPYLKAMGIPLKHGRFLDERDTEHSPLVVVIDEAFAHKFYPHEDPLGKHINVELIGQAQIVGVAGHIKHWGLDTDARQPIQAQMYLAFAQLPDKFMPLVVKGGGWVVRTQADSPGMADEIRRRIGQVDPQHAMYGVQTMDAIVSDSLANRRFTGILLDVFAALAMMLAAVGIYGVISYLVGQRTHEIGVRMALGAQRGDVLQLILGQGTKIALAGVAVGLAAALGLTRLMSKMLFGVSPTDPLTFGGVAVLLVGVALVACYVPARRAMRVDPIIALRYE